MKRAAILGFLVLLTAAFTQISFTGGTSFTGGISISGSSTFTYQARTDLNVAKYPATLSSLGGLTGAGTVVNDDLGNGDLVGRLTDANFDPSQSNDVFITETSGNSDINIVSKLFNTNHSFACIDDWNNNSYPVDINDTAATGVRLYTAAFPTTGGLVSGTGTCTWSHTNWKAFYIRNRFLTAWDYTDWATGPRTTPPTAVNQFDFLESTSGLPFNGAGNCLPAGYSSPTWVDDISNDNTDTFFSSGFSNTGGQGTGVKVAVYKVGSGCSTLDTSTGVVSGDWGSTGTATMPVGNFGVHSQRLTKDGKYLIIECTPQAPASSCANQPYFWQIGTTTVGACGSNCGGHFTEGYLSWVNGANNSAGEIMKRLFTALSSPTDIVCGGVTPCPAGINYPWDMHLSWNAVDGAETNPFITGTMRPYTPPTSGTACGMMSISGLTGTWITGHQFNTSWTGTIDAEGAAQALSSVSNTTSLTFTSAPGNIAATPFCFNPIASAWTNELMACTLAGVCNRFSHLWSTGGEVNILPFDATDSICSGSQNHDLALCTTTYLGNFGSSAGASTCIPATTTPTCRSDVIVIALR
jgi:hypothetical protein